MPLHCDYVTEVLMFFGQNSNLKHSLRIRRWQQEKLGKRQHVALLWKRREFEHMTKMLMNFTFPPVKVDEGKIVSAMYFCNSKHL